MYSYREALEQLNTAQRQAVQTTDGPVLVIAGPGTGKTQLLTTRIAHILATTDTLPHNILCLTFTDSAAHTMRERLAKLVGQAAYEVTISTYHAFGADLIRRYPEYFAASADLEPVDDLGIDRTLRAIVARLPFSNPLKYSDAYLPDIKTFISDAKRALLTPDDIRAIATDNLQFIEQASITVREVLANVARIDKKTLPLFETLLTTVERSHLAAKGSKPSWSGTGEVAGETLGSPNASPSVHAPFGGKVGAQPLHRQFLDSLEEALTQAQATNKTIPITAWKNHWLAKDAGGKFIVDGQKANTKLLAAADIYQTYLDTLKSQNLFDFDDMILRAIHTLSTNQDLRYTLQEQYQYLLLDEFQDTNGAQLRLVELLTDNPVHEGRPNVLAVGDDDQAIYAFQGADYSHMLHFARAYRDVLVVPLTQNYRSHADILHTAQGISGQIEERLHHHFTAIDKTLTPANSGLPKTATIQRRQAQSDVMQFAWIATKIQQLLQSGTPASEIAVLAPKHKYLEPLVPFLAQVGVPMRYDKRENILDDPAITQLLRMSELVLALGNKEQGRANALWAEVLSFDFWGLPTSRIWQLSWQTTDDAQDWTSTLLADPTLAPIALFFIRLSQLAASENLETMLDYLIGSTPLDLHEPGHDVYSSAYYQHYFGVMEGERADFWNLLSNLIVLRARLREYRREDGQRLTLQDLLDFVEAHQNAELAILNTSPYASSAEAAQLLTAYKAKGMEFSAVFLLAVNDEAWGSKARSQTMRISLPPNLQFMRYAGATNDERLRLLYVAVTRAKSQLYLLNYSHNYAGKATTSLKYLEETVADGKPISPLLPAPSQAILPAEDATPAPTTELAAYWQQRHTKALTTGDLKALLHERLKRFQLSATHLCDFVDLQYCGPQAFFLRTVLRFPQAPKATAHYGSAIHETLEQLYLVAKKTRTVPSVSAAQALFANQLQAKRLNPHDYQQLLDRGTQTLAVYWPQRSATILEQTVVTEYNFRNEGVFVGQAHLTGKIDKLILHPDTKEITIVDYKTAKPHSRWTHEVSLHKYRLQLYMYKLLVENSHTYRGYRVTDAYLDFVEPDEDGTVQTLHLAFDAEEEQQVAALIQSVWQCITALDLPDVASYSADMAGITAFENDLRQLRD